MAPLPTALFTSFRRGIYWSNNDARTPHLSLNKLTPDISVSLLRESSPDEQYYLASLGLSEQSDPPSSTTLFRRDARPTSPLLVHDLTRRAAEPVQTFNHGQGTQSPLAFNNQGFMALFAIVGAGMVLASIWFFFWAKNGGFVFRQGDWEDYKSTVLRRKGPDGKTLSNATKSTNLGHGSVAGTFSDGLRDEMVEVRHLGGRKKRNEHRDKDVLAYRHEKPARVGGLNRAADGSHFDYSNTNRSEVKSEVSDKPLMPPPRPKEKQKEKEKKKGFMEKKREKKQEKKIAKAAAAAEKQKKTMHSAKAPKPKRSGPSAAYSFTTGEDTATVISSVPETLANPPTSYLGQAESRRSASNSYYDEYRPNAAPPSYRDRYREARRSRRNTPSHTPTSNQSRQSSPRKSSRTHHSSREAMGTHSPIPPHIAGHSNRNTKYADDITEASYFTEAVSDTGTKVYEHHIPGLSKGTNDGGRRGRDVMAGYRREGAARRDSLSDSEGDFGTMRY